MTCLRRFLVICVVCFIGFIAFAAFSANVRAETLVITVVDKDTGQPIACRMHLKNAAKRPRRVRGLPFWKDHFVLPGKVTLKLPRGNYTFEIERGPEYLNMKGHFTINRNSEDRKQIALRRIVDMKKEGWWSGELHVHRPLKDIPLLMQAEDLHVAPVITWWNNKNEWRGKRPPKKENLLVRFDKNRFYHQMAGEDERGGGALLMFGLEEPLEIAGAQREYPSSMVFLEEAKRRGAWIDVEKPFWWDVPLWLASGKVDSIGLANNHMQRGKMYESEAWGKPRDEKRFPAPRGNGQWSQEIYYQVLNAGLRIPPSAGSASGVLANPLGYNRAYVHVDGEFTYEKWWEGLRRGRVVVTNGPLLRPKVNGRLPGYVFQTSGQDELELEIALNLAMQDKVSYLEVIKNGELAQSTRLDDWAKKNGKLPKLVFKESGWFLIRAVTDLENTYRFASTGPYYVEFNGRPRVSKRSAQFFLDWVDERTAGLKLDDPEKRREVLQFHQAARKYWQGVVAAANAE